MAEISRWTIYALWSMLSEGHQTDLASLGARNPTSVPSNFLRRTGAAAGEFTVA